MLHDRQLFRLPRVRLNRFPSKRFLKQAARFSPLEIGDLICPVPIVQGGMAVCISLSELASAVAEAGGIGVIAATAIGMLEKDYFKNGRDANRRALRGEIRRARKRTNGVLGVNIMVAADDFHSQLDVAVQEGIDVVFLGAGLPIRGIPVAEIREAGVKVVPIVSSARAARLIFSQWEKQYQDIPDAVVVEGPLAGGHLGFKPDQIEDEAYRLENLIPPVVEQMAEFEGRMGRQLPVIAAGGIFTGADIHRFLTLGARGVQLGTRFVATEECDADIRFKEAYTTSRPEDIRIIHSPVGLPGRALNSPFLEEVDAGKRQRFGCPWQCLASCDARKVNYCISMALYHARRGNLSRGFAFAGANVHRIRSISSVPAIVNELKKEFSEVAREGLFDLKKEYKQMLAALRTIHRDYRRRLRRIKHEYERRVRNAHPHIQTEYHHFVLKVEKLKREYMLKMDRARKFRDQLISMIEAGEIIKSI